MPGSSSASAPRLGFFGGSFDPLHRAHLCFAELAVERADLDLLLLCPAHHAPLRPHPPLFSPEQRLAMVESVCRNRPKLKACPLEIDSGETRFTYHTMLEVSMLHPGHELFLLLGQDQFARLEEWRFVEQLARLVHFLVLARDGGDLFVPSIPELKMTPMSNRRISLSSTELRRRLLDGELPEEDLPPEVCKLLRETHLPAERKKK